MLRVLFVHSYLQVNEPIKSKNAYKVNDNTCWNSSQENMRKYSSRHTVAVGLILAGGLMP